VEHLSIKIKISAVTPDRDGQVWFVTPKNGIAGVLDTPTGSVQ